MTKDEVKTFPIDSRSVSEEEPTQGEYDDARRAPYELKERILSSPEGRARYDEVRAEIQRHQATLAQVRKARAFAQSTIAEAMGMNQSEISRLEHRSDLLLSTLRRYIEATGGVLRLVAEYQETTVDLNIGEIFSESLVIDHQH